MSDSREYAKPANIAVVGNELAIAWSDGTESYIPLETLRRHCPCAGCGGEPDVLGNVVRPQVSYTDDSFQMRTFHITGGYAFQPVWNDGHSSGIFTYLLLQRLGELGEGDPH